MEATARSNPRIEVLQTSALPLGYVAGLNLTILLVANFGKKNNKGIHYGSLKAFYPGLIIIKNKQIIKIIFATPAKITAIKEKP